MPLGEVFNFLAEAVQITSIVDFFKVRIRSWNTCSGLFPTHGNLSSGILSGNSKYWFKLFFKWSWMKSNNAATQNNNDSKLKIRLPDCWFETGRSKNNLSRQEGEVPLFSPLISESWKRAVRVWGSLQKFLKGLCQASFCFLNLFQLPSPSFCLCQLLRPLSASCRFLLPLSGKLFKTVLGIR